MGAPMADFGPVTANIKAIDDYAEITLGNTTVHLTPAQARQMAAILLECATTIEKWKATNAKR